MATKTFVNISKAPWDRVFIVDKNSGSGTPILEKKFAEQLAAMATADGGRYVINSAMRTRKFNDEQGYGDSHEIGRAHV